MGKLQSRAPLSAHLLARKGQAGPSQLHAHEQFRTPPYPIAGGLGSGPTHQQNSDQDGNDQVKATFRLPSGLMKQLRLLAVHEDTCQQELVRRALEQFIEQANTGDH